MHLLKKKFKNTWIHPSVESAIRPVICIEGVSPPYYSESQSDDLSAHAEERFEDLDEDFIDSKGCKLP